MPGEEEKKIDWASLKYTAFQIGLSETEFKRMNPIEFYQLIDYHIKFERSKYGK